MATEKIPQEVQEKMRDAILKAYAEGKIIIATPEGLRAGVLREIIMQPADGILYDINRDEGTILTFLDDPKWVNDFAAAKVIKELKTYIEILEAQIAQLEKDVRLYNTPKLNPCPDEAADSKG